MSNREMKQLTKYKGLAETNLVAPMTREESEVFFTLGQAERIRPGNPSPEQLSVIMQSPIMNIMTGRLGSVGVDWLKVATPEAAIMVGALENTDAPGRAVVWAYTLLYLRVESGEVVSMDTLGLRQFPNGFPTMAAHKQAWEAQKVYNFGLDRKGSDNGLDRAELWKPLVDRFNEQEAANG